MDEPQEQGDPGADEGRRLERRVAARPASVPGLRHDAVAFAVACGAGSDVQAAVALAVTEAVTNAVVHAYLDREPGQLRVVGEPAEDALVIRVLDDGRGMQPRHDSPGLGLGLPTIGKLCANLDIAAGPGGHGTEVRMVFDAPGVAGPVVAPPADDVQELLEDVARLAEGAWPQEGVAALVDLVVPRWADVCLVDVLGEDGVPRRLAARVADATGAAIDPQASAILAGHRTPPNPALPSSQAVAERRTQIVELDDRLLVSLARTPREAELARASRMRWWISVPLQESGRAVGSIGFGLRAERKDRDRLIALFELLAERAARGLANARLLGELRRTHRRLERILAALAEAVTVQDASGRIVYANEAAARLLGAGTPEEVLRASPEELTSRFTITKADGTPVEMDDLPGFRLLAGRDAPPLLTRSVHRATGREWWLLTKATLLDDDGPLAVNIIEDVTAATNAARRQRFLAEAGELLASSLDMDETLDTVARLAVPALADWCAVDLLDEDGALRRVALAHVDPDKLALGHELHERFPPDLDAPDGVALVLREGAPVLIPEVPDSLIAERVDDPDQRGLLRAIGLHSVLIAPMAAREGVIGALTLVTAESGRTFTEEDLAFGVDLARRAAVAVENARAYQRRH
jgi:PAS domain S-box-containing protein